AGAAEVVERVPPDAQHLLDLSGGHQWRQLVLRGVLAQRGKHEVVDGLADLFANGVADGVVEAAHAALVGSSRRTQSGTTVFGSIDRTAISSGLTSSLGVRLAFSQSEMSDWRTRRVRPSAMARSVS